MPFGLRIPSLASGSVLLALPAFRSTLLIWTNPKVQRASMEPVIELVYEGLYMLRVELSFLTILGFLWAAGHFLSSKSEKRGRLPRKRTRVEELTPSTVEPEKLRDAQWIVAQITALCRSQVQRALELYRVALKAGLNIKDRTWHIMVVMLFASIAYSSGRTCLRLTVSNSTPTWSLP